MMIGRIDRHGRVAFPADFEIPARRKRWDPSVRDIVVWGLAVLVTLSLTASVMVSLRQALVHPAAPISESVLQPGSGEHP